MDLLDRNPFRNMKANDLKLDEVIEQWVELPGSNFKKLISPRSLDPMYILGGKGSGKTHLMRYCSFEAQAVRHQGSLVSGLQKDGYIGFYFRASALNGTKFEDLAVDNDKKRRVFEYSFDLYVAQIIIQTLLELEEKDSSFKFDLNDLLLENLKGIFLVQDEILEKCASLSEILLYLEGLSKEIDVEINRSLFSDEIDINIKLNRGSLVFGIPKVVSGCCEGLEDVNFIYLIDELENVRKDDQKYINTLIRERKNNVTFRVGARKHGVLTFQTLGSGESNREGHEFEVIRLDDLFTTGENYTEFAVELILKRLMKFGFLSEEQYRNLGNQYDYLNSLFACPDTREARFSFDQKGLSPVLKRFYRKLVSSDVVSKDAAQQICGNLSWPKDLVVEKAAIHLFCQQWARSRMSMSALIELSDEVRSENFVQSETPGKKIAKKIEYYKNNYVASVLRAKYKNNLDEYLGFDQILNITKGYPRHLITIFRHIFTNEVFNGVVPFSSGEKVSLSSQRIALKESFEWFHTDCVSEGKLGHDVEVAIARLGELLRVEYYADKPVECSASGFDVDLTKVNNHTKEVLKWAEQVRVLISTAPRQHKNSEGLHDKFHFNGLLCPRWGLPANRRGSLTLNASVIDVIFDKNREAEFSSFLSDFASRRNAPFLVDGSTSVDQLDLF